MNKYHLHINEFTLSLVLERRLKATGKWPIRMNGSSSISLCRFIHEDDYSHTAYGEETSL